MGNFGKSKVRLWENALESLGRILSDEYGVKVIFKSDMCMTTGKVIYLPVIPEGASQDFLNAIHGYLDHEVSHVIFTDFSAFEEAMRIGKKHQMMLNALEDGRSEAQMMKLWRGTRINLNNCREWSLPQLKEHWNDLSDFGKVVQGVCVLAVCPEDHWFTQEVLKQDTGTWARVESVKEIAQSAPEMESTFEALEAAKKIMEILQEEDEPEDFADQGDSAEQQEEGEGEQESTPQQQGDGDGDEGKSGKGQQNKVLDVSDYELEKDENILSTGNKIKQAAKDSFEYARDPDEYCILTTEGDIIEPIEGGDRQRYHQFLSDSRSLTHPIRQRFRRNLLSKAKCRWEPQKRRGSINPSSLHKVILGTSKNVFRKLTEAPSLDTCVSMFVDHSGSMFDAKLRLASQTAMIFGECLHEIKVPFEICGFSTGAHYIGIDRYERASEEERRMFTRWGDLWIGVYKEFNENWMSARYRCINMNRNERDNTFDGESLRIAAQRLLRRPEKRKILFWLNDGYPCPNVHNARQQHASYLDSVAREVEKVIEVFAIGIQSENVREYFTNWVVIRELEDLPKVVVGELDRLLRKKQNAYHGSKVA